MLLELCKGVHCVDLGESFQTHIYLQNLASIQPRTSPLKFARPIDLRPDSWDARSRPSAARSSRRPRRFPPTTPSSAKISKIGKSYNFVCKFLAGSFSAVSKRNFASKYAFESSRRDLHNALLCTALKPHFLPPKFDRFLAKNS